MAGLNPSDTDEAGLLRPAAVLSGASRSSNGRNWLVHRVLLVQPEGPAVRTGVVALQTEDSFRVNAVNTADIESTFSKMEPSMRRF